MTNKKKKDFCIKCRKNTEYILTKEIRTKNIKDKNYEYETLVAYCSECGEEMSIPGLLDYDIKAFDIAYREKEDIITVDEINKLIDIYNLGKAPLSLALGFGEITITRYLDGQVPSKNYSDIMRNALSSPKYMEVLLNKNKNKIVETAYKKSIKSINELENLFDISENMIKIISHIFYEMKEITPLALQKILYYIQGIYMVIFDNPIFEEDCEAWQHGPVYSKVYQIFKEFKYNPIDDNRFVFFTVRNRELTKQEKTVLDLVLNSFGLYGGKVLESITHKERPWLEAREGLNIFESSNEIIKKESIKEYFDIIAQNYNIETVEGINEYIKNKLSI